MKLAEMVECALNMTDSSIYVTGDLTDEQLAEVAKVALGYTATDDGAVCTCFNFDNISPAMANDMLVNITNRTVRYIIVDRNQTDAAFRHDIPAALRPRLTCFTV